jgi:hypothetical protein
MMVEPRYLLQGRQLYRFARLPGRATMNQPRLSKAVLSVSGRFLHGHTLTRKGVALHIWSRYPKGSVQHAMSKNGTSGGASYMIAGLN